MTQNQMKAISRALRFEYVNVQSMEGRKVLRSAMITVANAINSTSPKFNRTLFLCDCGHPEYLTGRFYGLTDKQTEKHDAEHFGLFEPEG